jgi:hypothetical protein
LARLEELRAQANVETDRIEVVDRRAVVAGRPAAALLPFSGAAMAATRLL